MEWFIAAAAIAFIVLVIFLITLIQTAKSTMRQIQGTLDEMKQETNRVMGESEKLLQSAHQLTDEVKGKIASFDGIFSSARHVGEAVEQVTASFKQASAAISHKVDSGVRNTVHTNGSTIADTLSWAQQTFDLWNAWRKRSRNNHQEPKS
ncbi:DUF948 domain-containing protein [Marinicrinis lubricantis]|uniref:DUF948 domain-containing protein n=1 Tax=Marinicrinis lubricantis TaxID=2086470 RepID=A0ABW1IT69_9BACL